MGYSEPEVLGRNYRFLQSPTGNVAKGEPRRFPSPEAVPYMRKLLSSSKECQTILINYSKGRRAFFNLVSVIPLRGGVHNTPEEADEVAYHTRFQVDLMEQPIGDSIGYVMGVIALPTTACGERATSPATVGFLV